MAVSKCVPSTTKTRPSKTSSCWSPKDSSPKDENRARLDPYLDGQVLPASDQPAPLEFLPLHTQLLAVHDRSHREVRAAQRCSERYLENHAMPSGNPRWLRPALSDVGFAPLRCAYSTVTYLKVPTLRGLINSNRYPLMVGSEGRESHIAVNHSPIAGYQRVIDRDPNDS